MPREVARTRVAAAVTGALSRKDLGKRRLPRETRSMAASACVTSWVLRGAGMWPQLGVLARRKVDVALVAPYSGRAGAARRRWQRAAHDLRGHTAELEGPPVWSPSGRDEAASVWVVLETDTSEFVRTIRGGKERAVGAACSTGKDVVALEVEVARTA